MRALQSASRPKEAHMRLLRTKKFLVMLVGVTVAGGAAAIALPAVVSTQVVNDSSSVHFQVVRRLAEGFDSGWHVHPGLAIVQVQEGSVAITQGSCTAKTLGPGDTYIEVPYVPVRAVAAGHLAWTTTFIIGEADPSQIAWSAYSSGSPNPCP